MQQCVTFLITGKGCSQQRSWLQWSRSKVSMRRPADSTAMRSQISISSRRSLDTTTRALPWRASSASRP